MPLPDNCRGKVNYRFLHYKNLFESHLILFNIKQIIA